MGQNGVVLGPTAVVVVAMVVLAAGPEAVGTGAVAGTAWVTAARG